MMNFSKGWDQLEKEDQYRIIKEAGGSRYTIFSHSSPSDEENETARKAWEARRKEKRLFKETYADYLRSDAWKKKREAVLDRDEHRCRFCGAPATEVHHLTYDRKFNESLFDLVSICSDCHEAVHVLKHRSRR